MREDTIGSGAVPVVCLTEVFRQAAASRIIVSAHRVNHGEMPELASSPDSASDFYFVEIESPEEGLAKIIQIVAGRIPQRFGSTFATGDKVMRIENDHGKDVYNGDIAFVRAIDQDLGDVTVDYDGRARLARGAPLVEARRLAGGGPAVTSRRVAGGGLDRS